MKLHDVKEGSAARVLAVTGDARFVSRVTAVGLTEGCRIEVLQNVRKRFFRVYSDRSRMTGGSGLGLSIIDNILALHHGTLRIESTLGQGTTVALCLPFL